MKDCPRAARHPVWLIGNYVVKSIEDGGKTKKVECKACTELSIDKLYSGVATNMETHLKTRHPQLYKAMQDKQLAMKNEGKRIAAEAQTNNAYSSVIHSQVPPPDPPEEFLRLINQDSWKHGNNFEQNPSSSGKLTTLISVL